MTVVAWLASAVHSGWGDSEDWVGGGFEMTGSLYLPTEELFLRACYPVAMIWRVAPGLIRPISVQIL